MSVKLRHSGVFAPDSCKDIGILLFSVDDSAQETNDAKREPFTAVWPSIVAGSDSTRRPQLKSRASTESLRSLQSFAEYDDSTLREQRGLRRIRSLGPADSYHKHVPAGRLRQRRAAVSTENSVDQSYLAGLGLNEEDFVVDSSGMPVKKNTLRIATRFIGSLQKHQKLKAERVAAAAALATYLNDPRRYQLPQVRARELFSDNYTMQLSINRFRVSSLLLLCSTCVVYDSILAKSFTRATVAN